jgi:hypothetical protein
LAWQQTESLQLSPRIRSGAACSPTQSQQWRGKGLGSILVGEVLDPFVNGSDGEKRKATRRRGGNVSVLVTDAERKRPPVTARVLDRSTTGVCIEMSDRSLRGPY